jgi:hypothetical protein
MKIKNIAFAALLALASSSAFAAQFLEVEIWKLPEAKGGKAGIDWSAVAPDGFGMKLTELTAKQSKQSLPKMMTITPGEAETIKDLVVEPTFILRSRIGRDGGELYHGTRKKIVLATTNGKPTQKSAIEVGLRASIGKWEVGKECALLIRDGEISGYAKINGMDYPETSERNYSAVILPDASKDSIIAFGGENGPTTLAFFRLVEVQSTPESPVKATGDGK